MVQILADFSDYKTHPSPMTRFSFCKYEQRKVFVMVLSSCFVVGPPWLSPFSYSSYYLGITESALQMSQPQKWIHLSLQVGRAQKDERTIPGSIRNQTYVSFLYQQRGRRVIGISDLWSGQKPWWNWYLTPVVNFGEVQRAQLAKSTLFTSTLVPQVCSDAKERVGCGK